MEFIQHTINWCKGEIFEGRLFLLYGIAVTAMALLYWKFGTTPFAKAMFIPMLILGLLCAIIGFSLDKNNHKRIKEFSAAYQKSLEAFVKSEKERTEAFIKWYPYTMYIMSAVIIAGTCLFLFLPTPYGRAIGLTLILMGFSALFLDHFSEERADTYHKHIVEEIENCNF